MNMDMQRFHATFFEESREGLEAMEAGLLSLEQGNRDGDLINSIFRAAHSIKGGSATFGFDAIAGALAFGFEGADRFDLVIEQLDAIRRVGAHRMDVEQAAAHREIARVEDLRYVAVAGRFEPAFLGIKVQAGANAVIEAAADHVRDRRQSLQQGLHRDDDDAPLERRQAVQGGQALRDDVRMRAETVVGQGFPVRERQQRQRVVIGDQRAQVGFELVRLVVVGGDEQQRGIVGGRRLRYRPSQGGATRLSLIHI